MAYHDELLRQARELEEKNPENPAQADLRRAVSSAYYALFHLLIHEACLNWSYDESRPGLARMFDHGVMKRVSNQVNDASRRSYTGVDPAVVGKLRFVAQTFIRLQEKRHESDYDLGHQWTLT
jgi:hypothetical protein